MIHDRDVDDRFNILFTEIEKFASSNKPRKYSYYRPFVPPNLCTLCHMVSDKTGNRDLITPCGCSGTSLHVHESCLTSWLRNSGKVRCEACKAEYSNSNIKEIRAQLTVQKANICILVLLMPIGVVVVVAFTLIMNSVDRARRTAAATGVPNNGIGMPIEQFVFLCILLGSLTVVALWATVCLFRRKKASVAEDLTVSKV